MKEVSQETKDFMQSMKERIESPLPKEVLENVKNTIIASGKKEGEDNIEEVLESVTNSFNTIKDTNTRGYIVMYLLGMLPINLQQTILDIQPVAIQNIVMEGSENINQEELSQAMIQEMIANTPIQEDIEETFEESKDKDC